MNSINSSPWLDWVSQAGLRIIKANQGATGAFLASPTFAVYRYSWLRDGAFIALAASRAGQSQIAEAFHNWTADAIVAQTERVAAITAASRKGRQIDRGLLLPTRYLPNGEVEPERVDGWPNVQFDGYGTWLWALADHLGGAGLPRRWEQAVSLAADYLAAVWQLPCYDYWEEFGDRRHTSTLAAVTAGLRAAASLLSSQRHARLADEVWDWVCRDGVRDGMFVKGPADDRVDASLVSLAVPFGLVATDDPAYQATADRIESELTSPGGGIWRYLGDTYYGGGAWPLLTCWLGWSQLASGRPDLAAAKLAWARQFASVDGWLPEQVSDAAHAQQFEWRQRWVEQWGEPANPLVWSQAMYLLLDDALSKSDAESPGR